MNIECSGGSRSFAKEAEIWRLGVQWSAIRSWQQPARAIIEVDPLTTTWEAAEELSVDILLSIGMWSKLGVKLDKWVPRELTANQKIIIF